MRGECNQKKLITTLFGSALIVKLITWAASELARLAEIRAGLATLRADYKAARAALEAERARIQANARQRERRKRP